MTKVLVTGSGGFIGRHVVESLAKKGCEVIAVDINNSALKPIEGVTVYNCSIFDEGQDVFEKFGCPDICVHLAWRDGFVHNSDAHMKDISSHYTFIKNMLDGGLKKIAVMGTMHEIGYWEGAIDENTPCNPMSQYGIAKNALRQSIIKLCEESKSILYWLRAFYIVGDDTFNHSIFSKIVQMDKNGEELFPFTSGKNKYDFISVDELALQISTSVLQDDITGIINMCTGQPKSLGERVEEFIKDLNLKIRPLYGAYPDRQYDSPGVWGDATKINEILSNAKR